MCGIAGTLGQRGAAVDAGALRAMTGTLAHRGPDGEGIHRAGSLGLGHRRLSIIDLSAAAGGPMPNEDGSLWLVFNGEIYNFRELRRRLKERHRFRSEGDAEVILHLYEEQGEGAVESLEGMFVFALWDARTRRLLLARDRVGKKPLFYCDRPGLFAFASEVKALLAHPDVPREREPEALPLYLTYGYAPTPGTFYRHIRALPPGHVLAVGEGGAEAPRAYWRPQFRNGHPRRAGEAAEQLRELLRAAVARRLVADVPLGAFLSGGLDSSAVVALMAARSGARVKTFSIGFAADGGGAEGRAAAYDETAYARLVARHFGTEHTEFVVEPRALDLIDRLVWHHDGPFGDASAVPTYLLAEMTRSQVTVALNGDGGDEVFAGYLRLYGGMLSERAPAWALRALGGALSLLPEPRDRAHPLRVAKRFADASRLPLLERYLRWNAYFPADLPKLLRPELLAAAEGGRVLESFRAELAPETPGSSTLSRLLQLNFRTYLLDDLLVKMDRMTMAHGLEARSPFLDREVVEFGAALPDRLRMRWGQGKVLLRRAMDGILPQPVRRRRKMGFGAPLGSWFRGDLRAFLRDRLLDRASPLYEYLEPAAVAEVVNAHLEARADLGAQLWNLLTLESWLRQEARWTGRRAEAVEGVACGRRAP